MSERTVVGRLWAWGVVVVAGLLVLALVAGLSLFPRLGAGQDVIDGLEPAFTPERVAGDVAGISMVSAIVDLADPITTAAGGAAAEVPALVGFVAAQTGLTEAEVLAALAENFPHTTALLQAIPLEDVTAEVPELVAFLADTLGVSPDDVAAALDANFPRLAQSIAALPVVTNGWEDVAAEFPDAGPLTRFDGTDVASVPDLRDYFAGDVVAAVAAVADDFDELDGTAPQVNWFPFLLTVLGAIVVTYGLAMLLIVRRPLVPPFPEVAV